MFNVVSLVQILRSKFSNVLFLLLSKEAGQNSDLSKLCQNYSKGSVTSVVTYRFCLRGTSYSMDVGGWGPGLAPVTFLGEKLWNISIVG